MYFIRGVSDHPTANEREHTHARTHTHTHTHTNTQLYNPQHEVARVAQRPRGPRGRGRGGARARRRRRRWRWLRQVAGLLVVLLEAVEDVDDPAPRVEQVDDLLDVEAERRALHSRQRPSSASRLLRSTPWQVVVEFAAQTNFPDAQGRMLIGRPDLGRRPQHWRPPGRRRRRAQQRADTALGLRTLRTYALTKGLRPLLPKRGLRHNHDRT